MDLSKAGEFFGGVMAASIIWPIIKFCWDKFKAEEYIAGGAEKILNLAGFKVYDKIIRHIPDEESKEKLTISLDKAGNRGDAAWDKGIRGEKI